MRMRELLRPRVVDGESATSTGLGKKKGSSPQVLHPPAHTHANHTRTPQLTLAGDMGLARALAALVCALALAASACTSDTSTDASLVLDQDCRAAHASAEDASIITAEQVRQRALGANELVRVDVRRIAANTSVPAFLQQAAVPMLLQHTDIDRWPARNWTLDLLESAMPRLLRSVNQNDRPLFLYFNEEKPMIQSRRLFAGQVPKQEFQVLKSVPRAKFWAAMRSGGGAGRPYLYFTGDFNESVGTKLASDVASVSHVIACEGSAVLTSNIWVGPPNVTAHTHYDSMHNIYVQLIGRKTFFLNRPEDLTTARLHPRLHPSYRQSQCLLDQPCEEYDRAIAERTIVAALHPGDVLYLPPYWLHRVQAVDVSVSYNAWCDSYEYALMEDLFSLAIPLDTSWGKLERSALVWALRILLCAEIELARAAPCELFFRQLYGSRYELLFPRSSLLPLPASWQCQAPARTLDDMPMSVRSSLHPPVDEAGFSRAVQAIGAGFRDERMTSAVRDLHLSNYVEEVVYNTLGDVDDVPVFLLCASRWEADLQLKN